MSRYEEAPKDLCKMVAQIATQHHRRLIDAGVTIKTLCAFGKRNEEGVILSPALKHNGYQAAALIKKTSHKDRVAGLDDAILIIDGDKLPDWPTPRVQALIDHELTHLELVEVNGSVKRDDCQRPVLAIRLHDSQIGVFHEIMARHGHFAIDTEVVVKLCRDTRSYIQPLLDFDWAAADQLPQIVPDLGDDD